MAFAVCVLFAGAPGFADEATLRADAALFGALPRLSSPTLSPEGTHLAALEPIDGRLAVVVRPLSHLDRPVVAFKDSKVSVDWMRWVGETRLVVATSFPGKRAGVKTIETRLYGVDADGKNKIALPSRRGGTSMPQVGADIVAVPRDDPGHILLNIDRENRGVFSVYRVDVDTGDAELVERGTPLTAEWLTDRSGIVRLRVDYNGTSREIWARPGPDQDWRLVRRDDLLDRAQFIPLAFGQSDPQSLVVATDGKTGRLGIYPFDLTTSKLGPALFQRTDVDVQGIIQDAATGNILGYTFTRDREMREFLDSDLMRRQDELNALFPGAAVSVVSSVKGGGLSVVYTELPARPGHYVLRDPKAQTVTPLGGHYPALDTVSLAPVVSWTYTARDGLAIPAYVTLPAGASLADTGGRWPLVVMPHGGPTARDTISFDFIAQFLARQGYAVLQPNYRGSTGYGRDFENAGNGEWGRAMQNDVTDGARALVASGFADSRRVAIVGASYGGYSALIGAAREPDLFCAAVSISGVTDLELFLRQLDHFRFADVRKPRILDPPNDTAALAERSPVAVASRIKVPVLLIHGRKDHVVPFEHATVMERALTRAHVPVTMLELDQSDHNLNIEPERIALLESVGAFLARTMR